MRKLYLVRHGESELAASGRWQGHLPTPLSDKGRQQALRAAEYLRGTKVDAFYASTIARAHQTAEIIQSVLGLPEIRPVPGMADVDPGDRAGRTPEEMARLYPDYADHVRRTPWEAFAGGESLRETHARAMRALEAVLQDDWQQAVIVCHDGPIKYAILSVMGLDNVPDEQLYHLTRRLKVENGGIVILGYGEAEARVLGLNVGTSTH